MATEKYANLAETTVAAGGYTAGSGVLNVASTALPFPQNPNFRVRLKNSAKTLLKVTAIVSGTQWSVTAEENDGGAALGDVVKEVITAGALDEIRKDICQTGTQAARPAAEKAGILYLPSNGRYIWRDTGLAWAPWGPIWPMTEPVSGDYTWTNQGTASIDTSHGGVDLIAPATAGISLRIRKKAAPAAPYTITAAFMLTVPINTGSGGGLLWRESSTGKLVCLRLVYNGLFQLNISKFDSPTVFNSDYSTLTNASGWMAPGIFWVQIKDDNTNRKVMYSSDGYNFIERHSIGRTDFLTADEVGFFADSSGAAAENTILSLLHWSQS